MSISYFTTLFCKLAAFQFDSFNTLLDPLMHLLFPKLCWHNNACLTFIDLVFLIDVAIPGDSRISYKTLLKNLYQVC